MAMSVWKGSMGVKVKKSLLGAVFQPEHDLLLIKCSDGQ
jgi:hypothetical protein